MRGRLASASPNNLTHFHMRHLVSIGLLLLALAAVGHAVSADTASKMRVFDTKIAREIVSAVVLGFQLEEAETGRTTPWLRFLTMDALVSDSLVAQSIMIMRFQDHLTRDINQNPCVAYGEAAADTVATLRMNPAYTVPSNLGRRVDIVEHYRATCNALVQPNELLSPLQLKALQIARVLGVTTTSTQLDLTL